MTRLTMDLKVIPTSYKGHKCIIVVIDEVTNFMVTIPTHRQNLKKLLMLLCNMSSVSTVCLNI